MKKTFKILECKTISHSIYGNPKRGLLLKDDAGEIYCAKTGDNCAVAYMLDWGCVGSTYALQYHFTKSGNMIITQADKY